MINCQELSSGKGEVSKQGTCVPRAWPFGCCELCSESVGGESFFNLEILSSEFPGTGLKHNSVELAGLGNGNKWGKLALLPVTKPQASFSVWRQILLSAVDEPKNSQPKSCLCPSHSTSVALACLPPPSSLTPRST